MCNAKIYPLVLISLASPAFARPAEGVFIPSSYAHLLPDPFLGPLPQNGNLSTNFINTATSNSTVNQLFAQARNATYYALDQEFYSILGGPSPDIQLVGTNSSNIFYEGGAWVSNRNEVWFTSVVPGDFPSVISVLDLASHNITTLNLPALAEINPLGLHYFNGTVYVACGGNEEPGSIKTGQAGVYAVDATTLDVTPVLNSYFGLRIPLIDDLTVVAPNTSQGATSCTTPGETNLFFTSFSNAAQGFNLSTPEVLPNAVWRFSPQTNSLQAVISRADILEPNGINLDPSGKYIYITDTAAVFNKGNVPAGGGALSSGSSATFRFDLDENCVPYNKRLFSINRSYGDGIHVDDEGRVWTGEYDGIVVRNSRGKVLGVFNAEALEVDAPVAIANFALAGDKLVILAVNRLYVVQLGHPIVTAI